MSKVTNRIRTFHNGSVNSRVCQTAQISTPRSRSKSRLVPATVVRYFGAKDIYAFGRSGPFRRFNMCGHVSQMAIGIHDSGTIIEFTNQQKLQEEECPDCLY